MYDPWFAHVCNYRIEAEADYQLSWNWEVLEEVETQALERVSHPRSPRLLRGIVQQAHHRQCLSFPTPSSGRPQDIRHLLLCLESSHFSPTGDTRIPVPSKAKIFNTVTALQDTSDDHPRPTKRN